MDHIAKLNCEKLIKFGRTINTKLVLKHTHIYINLYYTLFLTEENIYTCNLRTEDFCIVNVFGVSTESSGLIIHID